MSEEALERERQFIRRLQNLSVAERTALKAAAERPGEPDVAAFDAFTAAHRSVMGSRLRRDACRLVAALYFWHPQRGGYGNIANALLRAVRRSRRGRIDWFGRYERSLTELLAVPFAGLHRPLFDVVRLVARAHVPIDWPQLLSDLCKWDRPDRDGEPSVQSKWAKSWLQTGGDDVD